MPPNVNLNNAAGGFTEIIGNPVYYRVYGDTAAQIKAQLRDCPAISASSGRDSYAAATSGVITWQYNVASDNSGLCALSNVKVGLHTRMVLPEWHATSAATSGLAVQWQRLMDGTIAHESEHVGIYQQHAKQLLGDLISMPATDCASVETSVKAKTSSAIATLNAAQAAHDARTGHGATEGAALR
jgi:predicted secreted Zn-dependent protease